ncbi:MAG TPA: hypothetical protein VMW08_19835 [Acidimicrobiales bacterium]|nr:hypothetical protein [Acidimicrobiales bacterium]
MALYVAVCLLAALTVVAESADQGHVEVFGIVWGTTVGLALAHWFAFRVSARLVGAGAVDRRDVEISVAQLLGAAAVAILCTIPIAVSSPTAELDAVRLLLAGFIALVGYQVARSNGSPARRAVIYAVAVLLVGLIIAMTKNVLSGH